MELRAQEEAPGSVPSGRLGVSRSPRVDSVRPCFMVSQGWHPWEEVAGGASGNRVEKGRWPRGGTPKSAEALEGIEVRPSKLLLWTPA